VIRSAEVRRVLDRYLVEVVERHALCPWARSARERGEFAVGILWGAPGLEDWVAEAGRLLGAPDGRDGPDVRVARVAMVVAPELAIERVDLAALRDRVAARIPSAGVAEFHPEAALDLATPARLVPFLRRSPDPMLQLVPLAVIDAARAAVAAGTGPWADRTQQAAMLGGQAPARRELTAAIAAANHATAAAAHAAIAAALDDISADRRAGYARAGISSAS
jgi:hypothetical protein